MKLKDEHSQLLHLCIIYCACTICSYGDDACTGACYPCKPRTYLSKDCLLSKFLLLFAKDGGVVWFTFRIIQRGFIITSHGKWRGSWGGVGATNQLAASGMELRVVAWEGE